MKSLKILERELEYNLGRVAYMKTRIIYLEILEPENEFPRKYLKEQMRKHKVKVNQLKQRIFVVKKND